VEAVHAATWEAVARARSGGGPSLLEMKTYRYRGHSRSDPAKYRPDGELEAWKARDPLVVLGTRLAGEGLLPLEAQAALEADVTAEVEAAVARAESAPYLSMEEARRHVYAG
jgi:TPP-dependent pyruvate/acetoin dehydrogenase alpha subunit